MLLTDYFMSHGNAIALSTYMLMGYKLHTKCQQICLYVYFLSITIHIGYKKGDLLASLRFRSLEGEADSRVKE